MPPDDAPRLTTSPVVAWIETARSDPDARGRLLEFFRDQLHRLARAHAPAGRPWSLGDSALVQDALLAAWRHFPAFRGVSEAELRAWLTRILHSLMARQARADARRPHGRLSAPVGESDAGDGPADFADPSQVPPDQAAADREQGEAVRARLAQLPTPCRRVLELRFFAGLTFEQIGRQAGVSGEAVRTVAKRGLSLLGESAEGLLASGSGR